MNMSGCAAKRRVRMVDLPAPEGPDMTTGREAGIVVVVVREELSWDARRRNCARVVGCGIVRGIVLRIGARSRAVEGVSVARRRKGDFMEMEMFFLG
jgi:hypothetical protein